MKRDLNAIASFDMRSRRGRALDHLFTNFLGERPLDITAAEEMWECLTPEERQTSFDTIATIRMRALMSEGKPVQAYQALMAGLRAHPTNLPLQLERNACLSFGHEQLNNLLVGDAQSPLIEILYDLLLKEAYLNPATQGRYCGYLVRMGKYSEAAKLAVPLTALFPAMMCLRDTVEEIVMHVPNEALQTYLLTPTTAVARPTTATEITPRRAQELNHKFKVLQDQIVTGSDELNIENGLREVIGPMSDLSPFDLTFKDFYLLKAIADGNRGLHWEAIILLQSLLEIDPCNLHYRRSLTVEIQRFDAFIGKQADKNELKADLTRVYSVLREFAVIPYSLLKQICLSEAKAGNVAAAKMKMDHLCSLNVHDGDYLLAALDVAIEAKDQVWMSELLKALEKLKAEKPWDLTVAAFETAA